ncbi:hypothetical protein [Luteibacter sp.]|jgi:hypothetical protein|uniref:hypothetical protein n=1 Tax=Luteibacter sp. TaxID=1886636 RepID=UPI002F41D7E2
MRRAHTLLLAVAACLPLAGCYYDPDYGYVRNGTGADAYYGEETVVSPGVYSPGYRYYDYGPACCYSDLSVGTVWYDGYDGRRYRRGGDWHGHPPPRGDWHDRHDNNHRPGGGWQGDNRSGWRGGNRPDRGDHRPGNWHGGGNPPSGGWHGGDRGRGHRQAPSATPRAAPSVRQTGTGRDRSRFRGTTD